MGVLYMEINRLHEHKWRNDSIHCVRDAMETLANFCYKLRIIFLVSPKGKATN